MCFFTSRSLVLYLVFLYRPWELTYMCLFCDATTAKNKTNWIDHMNSSHPNNFKALVESQKQIRRTKHEENLASAVALDAALENVGREVL